MKYQHLTIEEREKIQELHWQKKSLRFIAKAIGRSVSSLSREMKRNCPIKRRYVPRKAHERAIEKRKSRGRKDRLKSKKIRDYVTTHLKEGWSPEQISGRMKLDKVGSISHEAIYQFVYYQIHRNGYGYLKPRCEDLRIYLRRKQKRRRKKGLRRCQRVFVPLGLSIELRPKVVNQKKRIGDFEGDTVESANHKPGVNTLLERKTGMFFVTKVKDKTSSATAEAVVGRMANIPKHLKHTLTTDNGSENSAWQRIEQDTGLKTFFANPYSSYERGANENANGLLREYFPKKTDFSMIPDDVIESVELRLNSRPRKRLGWKTPLEEWGVALRG
jgi:IS30 family transposase